MPRKAKEKEIELNNLEKGANQEVSTSKSATVDKKTTKKTTAGSITSKTTKSSHSSKKTSAKTKKKTKTTASKTIRKTTVKKTSVKSDKAPTIVEYYDLPFRYNQTVVKILAQTPNILFVYWDISDKDRNTYTQKYGPDFFQNTRPYLIITNETMHYTFEVEINDFANSWYLHVNDADCEYRIELGRKFITNSTHHLIQDTSKTFVDYTVNDYLPITSSNEIEMPNNHILFDKLGKSVFFRNVKTDIMSEKDISSLSFLQKIGNVYHIYDLYKEIYHDELISDEFGLNLPSSGSSSSFK